METKFNFNSQICTSREQSERLLALGLKPETADCYLFEYEEGKYKVITESWLDLIADEKYYSQYKDVCFPAWSLHRLIEMMPIAINDMLWFSATHDTVLYDSLDYIKTFDVNDNLYGNIIDCIEWLIKEGYFNKEYLEEKQ